MLTSREQTNTIMKKVIQRVKKSSRNATRASIKELHELGFTFNKHYTMKNKEKEGQAQGAETINFNENVSAEVEQLRKELDEAKKQTEQYKDWWYSGVKEVEEQQKVIDGLKGELDKVAAVAELYLKSKVWQK